MTIHELLAAAGLTANDEIPIWDAEATGEPTKKVTAQQLAAAVVSLANLVTGVKGNTESSYRTGNVNITPANIGAAYMIEPSWTIPYPVGTSNQSELIANFEHIINRAPADCRYFCGTEDYAGWCVFWGYAYPPDENTGVREWADLHYIAINSHYYHAEKLGGTWAIQDLTVMATDHGGTGATTPDGARSNLGALGSFATGVLFGGSATNFYQNLGAQISTMADQEARIFVVTADVTDEPFGQWHTYSGTIVRYANATCGGILTDQTGQIIAISCNGGIWSVRSL